MTGIIGETRARSSCWSCSPWRLLRWRRATRQRLVVSPRELTLPADGAPHRAIEVRLSRGGRIDADAIVATGVPARVLPESGNAATVEIQSPVNPGTQRLVLQLPRRVSSP